MKPMDFARHTCKFELRHGTNLPNGRQECLKTKANNSMKPKLAILGIAIILNVAQTIWSQVPSTNRVLSFDGNSSYVSIPSSPLIQNSNEITVEAWIYPLPPTTNPDHGWFVAKSDGINLSSARTFELDWWVSGGNTGIGIGLEANFFLGTTNWAVVG